MLFRYNVDQIKKSKSLKTSKILKFNCKPIRKYRPLQFNNL